MGEDIKVTRAADSPDQTPPAMEYLYQYRNEYRPNWSQPWNFARHERPEIKEPTSITEAQETLQQILSRWCAGTEMRVLARAVYAASPIYRKEPPEPAAIRSLATPQPGE